MEKNKDLVHIACSLLDWASRPHSYHFADFLFLLDLSIDEFRQLCRQKPVEKAYQKVRQILYRRWVNRFETEEVPIEVARVGRRFLFEFDGDLTGKAATPKGIGAALEKFKAENPEPIQSSVEDFSKVKMESDAIELYEKSAKKAS